MLPDVFSYVSVPAKDADLNRIRKTFQEDLASLLQGCVSGHRRGAGEHNFSWAGDCSNPSRQVPTTTRVLASCRHRSVGVHADPEQRSEPVLNAMSGQALLQRDNHWPLAKKLARETEVRWGEHQGIDKVIADLKARGATRIGLMGALGYAKCKKLEAAFGAPVDLNPHYVRLRLVKSPEEIDWMRIGAALTDLAIEALRREAKPGMTERELGSICESAYHPHGGVTYIHFFLATPMANPEYCVPRQLASTRKVQPGDVIATEITAHFFEYPGQVLRTFTVAAEPTPLYRRLHETAEAAFDAVTGVIRHGTTMPQIIDAAGLIEDAGFSVYDDLMHGFGGGYLPPVLGTRSRPAGPLPDMPLEAGMTCVVQPNVITRDEKAGVQVGELVLVTDRGFERLHRAERGLFRLD